MNILFDEYKCPVCGRKFIIRCRPDEWGCVGKPGEFGKRQGRVLLCSIGCMRKHEQDAFARSVEKVRGMKAFRLWWLLNVEGRSTSEIVKMTGVRSADVSAYCNQIDLFYWAEAEWLRERTLNYGRV